MDALDGYGSKTEDDLACLSRLSQVERRQLGTRRAGSKLRYATPREWARLRGVLVRRSIASNPKTNPELTAYTPGECLALLDHPEVAAWLEWVRGFLVPKHATIVLVPCAKTKPWATARVGLYADYNELRRQRDRLELGPRFYFVTISEPLGLVPEERWATFPQYDVPGLFRSESMRTSMFAEDWRAAGFERLLPPWDEVAYLAVIRRLGETIGAFLDANAGADFVSFVEDASMKGTHSAMLDIGCMVAAAPVRRFNKRPRARGRPGAHIVGVLRGLGLLR
jgi:hypothetical protein